MAIPKLKTTPWDGKPITQPGLYGGIGLDAYHNGKICNGPSVSSSGLRRLFAYSPAHFYVNWPCNPAFQPEDDKPHFVLGRAAHHLMLGEEYFSKLFCVQPEQYADTKTGELKKWTYAANVCKAWREARQKEGLSILTQENVESIKGMADSLSRHPIIVAGALNGMIERSMFWQDKETGLWVKARPDAIPNTSIDFCDLKTTTSVLWPDLQRTIFDYGYHQQGSLVRSAAREILGIDAPTFTLIFVETKAPYCVRVVSLKDSDLDRGEKQNRAALDTVARCLKSGRWPGPGGDREDAEHIELPEFAQRQIDDRLEFGIA